MHTGDSIMCLCVRKREGLWLWPRIYQPCCRLQCVAVKRELGPQGRPTGVKTALSVGCVSQWAAEPWGAALLITAGVVCQCRHMMHSAITVGGGDKTRSKIGATPCNKSARHPHTSPTAGAHRRRRFVPSYPTCKARSWSHGGEGRIYYNPLIARKHNLKPREHQYN